MLWSRFCTSMGMLSYCEDTRDRPVEGAPWRPTSCALTARLFIMVRQKRPWRGVPSDACATWQAHGRHPVHGVSMRSSLQLEIVRQEICVSALLCVPSMFGSRFILMNLV